MGESENIKLSFPMNAAYVSSVRMTASSIAKRMAFDIGEIEDIKTAVSETCTYLLKSLPASADTHFDITFRLDGNELTVTFSVNALPVGKTNDLSLTMVKALVDELVIFEDGPVVITMAKTHKESIFD